MKIDPQAGPKTTQNRPKRLSRASFFQLRFRLRFLINFGAILPPKMAPSGHPFRDQNRPQHRSKFDLEKRLPQESSKTRQELPREAPGRPKSTPGGPKRRPGGSPGGPHLENPLRFLRLKSLKSVNCKCDVGIQCFSSSLFFAFPFFLKVLPNPVGFLYRRSVPLLELSEGSEGREGRTGRKGRGIANFLGSGR